MQEQKKIPLLVVAGPTASGKTRLAVALAKRFDGEVISADSMQVYRDLLIGTARPTEEEMEGVPHHLCGILPLTEEYSVARFVEMAAAAAEEIARRGCLPILAGGTGLYISALVENLRFAEEQKDEALRARLRERADREGGAALLEELRVFDPQAAETLHPNNVGRIIRAIEVYRTSGVTMTEQRARSRAEPSPYRLCMLGLSFRERGQLYRRIDERVEQMLERGLLEEARRVLAMPGAKTAMQAIGYKELAPYFQGEVELKQAVENLKQATRRYAKRQLTWFRRDERFSWLYADDYNGFGQLVQAAGEAVLASPLFR